MDERLRFLLNRVRERLWIKPLIFCILSVFAALLARYVDSLPIGIDLEQLLPNVKQDSIEDLLKVTASSMLVIATFSVSSMVSAYASAANTATPRTFRLIIADDVSQNALSTFIGVFIFSIVALMALMNGYYGKPGRFILFSLTLITIAVVIFTFVRWVDSIARLGRMGTIIERVETATAEAMEEQKRFFALCAKPDASVDTHATPIYAHTIGYVQRVDVKKLQRYAEENKVRITVAALPGAFATPNRPIAYVVPDQLADVDAEDVQLQRAFVVGRHRLFDQDPRFGLVVLSEIAARALSAATNDPGTAIDVIGAYVRLFIQWSRPARDEPEPECKRVAVADISVGDMFDDAFTSLARDGAAVLEVQVRLQKAFRTLASTDSSALRREAERHAESAFKRAEQAMRFPADVSFLRSVMEA